MKHIKLIFSTALLLLFALGGEAQTQQDSLTIAHAQWETDTLAHGAVCLSANLQLFDSPQQIAIIKRFWGHLFFPSTESENKQQFIQLWQILFDLYTRLRDNLASQNKAYEGMIFRDVAERCRRKEELDLPYTQVGSGILSRSGRVYFDLYPAQPGGALSKLSRSRICDRTSGRKYKNI